MPISSRNSTLKTFITLLTLLFSLSVISACGGGGKGGSTDNHAEPSTSNQSDSQNAGNEQADTGDESNVSGNDDDTDSNQNNNSDDNIENGTATEDGNEAVDSSTEDETTADPSEPVPVPEATIPAESVEVNSQLPQPENVRAFGDDRNAIVVWDPIPRNLINQHKIVGYYITYREAGSDAPYRVRQQQAIDWHQFGENYPNAVQIQPLENGKEYEIHVQAASGSWVKTEVGNLVYQPESPDSSHTYLGNNLWPVADGKVSEKSSTKVTASSARVDAMRARLTGFFDDFNTEAGAIDERLWNTASTPCVVPHTGGSFINPQYHTHNQVASNLNQSCDRGGIAARPRATFDISQATENNPAVIEFDLDGATQPRDTWYLDIIPLSSRPQSMLPVDITSHNDSFDIDQEDTPNTLRINAAGGAIHVAYYDTERMPSYLRFIKNESSLACSVYPESFISPELTLVEMNYGCDYSKRISSLNPLPFPDVSLTPITNVRAMWRLEITPTRLRTYINGLHIATNPLPSVFVAEKKYTVHFTTFSYNTGKDYSQVIPYVELLHWDNFGFSGPAPDEVIHNYIEGGERGDIPVFSTSSAGAETLPLYSRTTIIPIPDTVGELVDGKARLYYTLGQMDVSTAPSHAQLSSPTIMVNGHVYPFDNPRDNMLNTDSPVNPVSQTPHGLHTPFSTHLLIDQNHIKTGDNVIDFNIGATGVLNVHLELPYAKGSQIPDYSSPSEIFGKSFLDITKPPITNCDKFWFVERDLGLPYEDGKTNLEKGPCFLTGSHQSSGK